MKLSTSLATSTKSFSTSLTTLFLIIFSIVSMTMAEEGTESLMIDPFELRAVGEAGIDRKPAGQILTLEPFMGYAYFEVHPSMFGQIHVELFAGAINGESCDSGVLLQSTDDNQIVTDSFPYGDYNEQFADLNGVTYPVTSNGAVAAAVFIIGDIRIPDGDQQMYFPNKGVGEDGQAEICVRMSTKFDYDNDSVEEYVGYVDQYFVVEIDWTANTATFTNVDVFEEDAGPLLMNLDVNATADVKSYICDDDNAIIEQPVFGPGQYFRICVGPEDDEDDNYSVSGFKALICSNDGETRNLVQNYATDPLTNIDNEADQNGVRAIRSMVTPGFMDQGNSKFTCEGLVTLDYEDGSRRSSRILSEQTNPFEIEVDLKSFQELAGVGDGKEELRHIFYLLIFVILFVLLGVALCKQRVGNATISPFGKKSDDDENDNDLKDEEKAFSSVIDANDEKSKEEVVASAYGRCSNMRKN